MISCYERRFLICSCASFLALLAGSAPLSPRVWARAQENTANKKDKSLQAFRAVASVLTSPRCLNCHIPGDTPLHGDDGKPHKELNIKRGPDGRGTPAMRCTNCHQSENAMTPHAPPGAPNWQLPPPSMRMAWQGLSTGDLCRTLKDPSKNGNMTLAQLYRHLDEHPLVLWAWNPGPGRSIPPLSHEQFMSRVKEWMDTGAACAE